MKFGRGFTLIELLVVIAIIGVLAAIILASLSSARDRSHTTAIQSELREMQGDFELGWSLASSSYTDFNGGGGGTGAKSVALRTAGPDYSSLLSIQTEMTTLGTTPHYCVNPNPPEVQYALYASDPATGQVYCRDSVGNVVTYSAMPANQAGGNCPPASCQ